jgi:hypothetical protein
VNVLPAKGAVEIKYQGDMTDVNWLVGRVVHFSNSGHRTAHTIHAAQRDGPNLLLSLSDDFVVALVKIDAIDAQSLTTSTALPLAPCYRGTSIADELFRFIHPVTNVEHGGKIQLAKPLPPHHLLNVGDKLWLLDVAPGDSVEVPWIGYKQGENAP